MLLDKITTRLLTNIHELGAAELHDLVRFVHHVSANSILLQHCHNRAVVSAEYETHWVAAAPWFHKASCLPDCAATCFQATSLGELSSPSIVLFQVTVLVSTRPFACRMTAAGGFRAARSGICVNCPYKLLLTRAGLGAVGAAAAAGGARRRGDTGAE